MIARLIAFSARHRWPVILATAAFVALALALLPRLRLDALPDLSDTQVIVVARWDRSPDLIEDQVTYPIVTSLLGTPKVEAIRATSDFGSAFLYVVFADGTDPDWARTRVLEGLRKLEGRLPAGVRTEIGPDASGVGWVYQYALTNRLDTVAERSGPAGDRSQAERPLSLDELRSLQDWTVRYALQGVPGVAEVASVGGYVRQVQISVDPNRLAAYGLTLPRVIEAVRRSNGEAGGRLLEVEGAEVMVRGRGYARTPDDFESIVLANGAGGVPVTLSQVARVETGPEIRRGVADLDGLGEAVGGIVVMRQGENALRVIERVKARLASLQSSLPPGVEIVATYDRSDFILRALDALKHEVALEMIVVSLVILLFLWHLPSALVPIVTLPVSVLLAFLPMYLLGIEINLLSLAGIAISIGVLVDGAIVEVENAHHRVRRWLATNPDAARRREEFFAVRLAALQEVGPTVFYSLLILAVAFLPIFALLDQEGRLFRPLAASKNLTMAIAALLALTLDPALRMAFSRIEPFDFRPRLLSRLATRLAVGTYRSEEEQPLTRALARLYEPACRFVLRHPKGVIGAALLLLAASIPLYLRLGREFMPPLREGTILYMPIAQPNLSIARAARLLQEQDRALRRFPEVERVFGKAGRAETATDPAPLSMTETTIVLKPEKEWRRRERWYSGWAPEPLRRLLRTIWPDSILYEELIAEMDAALRTPGVTNAWTMPIRARIDMLATGIRTPVGIKIRGRNAEEIERLGRRLEEVLRRVPGTRSAFAERVAEGRYLDIEPRRADLARYGLTVADLHEAIVSGIGGENVTTVVAGRERYPVNVRYSRELRDDPEKLERIPIPTPAGSTVLLSQVADVAMTRGPSMIRDDDGFLTGYLYVDLAERDLGGYVEAAKRAVAAGVPLPAGMSLEWSGQVESLRRVEERLRVVVPFTLILIFALLYASTRSTFKATVVLLAVPFSALGAVWLFALLGYNVSIAAWVGMIALLGLDAETGVFMLLFLDLALKEARETGALRTVADLDEAIVQGAVRRARPKLMTVAAAFLGLLPILASNAIGSDLLKRIAAPMVGGLVTSFLLELLLYPALYKLRERRNLPHE